MEVRNKKAIIISIFTVFLLLFSTSSASAKVMWGKTELKQGQIGKVTILTNVNAVKQTGNTIVQGKRLKKGEEFRVYSYRVFGDSGYYGLGGGLFVKKSDQVKYETPSKVKLQALGVKVSDQTYAPYIKYPKIEGLISGDAERKINNTILNHIKGSYQNAVELENDEISHRQEFYNENGYHVPSSYDYAYSYEYDVSYEVKYNKNNVLSILIYDYMYMGGAHGSATVASYNFDMITGNQISLSSVAKNSSAYTKMERYARVDLLNQNAKMGMVFIEDLHELNIDNSRPFYFYDNGIVVKFYEYEVAAYAAGMPEVKIPYSVFR